MQNLKNHLTQGYEIMAQVVASFQRLGVSIPVYLVPEISEWPERLKNEISSDDALDLYNALDDMNQLLFSLSYHANQQSDDIKAALNLDENKQKQWGENADELINNACNVSVHTETWDEDDVEAGETNNRETIYQKVNMSYSDFIDLVKAHGAFQPSSSVATPHMWFISSDPVTDFRTGESTYYNIFINSINGIKTSEQQYSQIAQDLGINLSAPIAQPSNKN